MSSNDAVNRVLSESRVSPPPGSVPTSSLPLTFFDIMWLLADDPVQRLFFYHLPHPTSYFLDSILPDLKASLSLALQHFYFLAGKLRPSPGSGDKYDIFYTDGDSISFTVAECDEDFQGLFQGRKNHFVTVLPLVPLLVPASPTSRPLFAVQVTVFPNSGICIGVATSHIACDGSSSIHFIKTWASAFRSGGSTPLTQPPPVFDRAAIADPLGLYSIFITRIMGLLEGASNINPSPPSTQTGLANHADGIFSTFVLGPDHIQKLKKGALASAETFHCSAFAVACAHVWVCLVKTRARKSVTTTSSAHMLFTVDCRGRLRPPLPASYFGNCLGPCYVEAGVGSLIGEDGFRVAAKAIGRAIGRFAEGALDNAEEWLEKGISLVPAKMLTVAGSPKLRVYDTDFGWGRPLRVVVPSISYTGALSIAESREEGGGLEIGLVLHKDEMDEFEAHFFKGLGQST